VRQSASILNSPTIQSQLRSLSRQANSPTFLATVALEAIVLFGVITWRRGIPPNPLTLSQCIWSSPECSTAAATWSLLVLAVAALVPALRTAVVASNVFQLESEPALQLDTCEDDDHKRFDRILACEVINDQLVGRPLGRVPENYWTRSFEIENVGRSLARDAYVWLGFRKGKASTPIGALKLGPIPKDRCKHVVVCGSEKVLPLTVVFSNRASVRGDKRRIQIDLESSAYETFIGGVRNDAPPAPPGAPQLPLTS